MSVSCSTRAMCVSHGCPACCKRVPCSNFNLNPKFLMADAMTWGSAAQAAGLAEAAELPAPQGPLGAGAEAGEEPGEMGLVLGKRHQRMFKASEDEFLLKYWVRCG